MRYVSPAKAVAVSILMSAAMFGQTLTVTNFQLVSQVYTNYTYTAQINNTGGALASVTATATSQNPFAVRIAPNEGTLNFGPVPANGSATSSNSFTLIVVGGAPLSWSNIAWTFQTTPAPPVANAGPNQTATLHQTVTLDGSASTNPSVVGTLTYLWSFVARPGGSSAFLMNSQSVHPTFVVDVAGTYTIKLTVGNGVATSSATATVNASTDTPPVANAGPNQTVTALPASVTLSGAASSDVNGDPLTFLWSLTSIPLGSTATLSNPTAVNPTFVADKDGNYVAQLVVNDGILNSTPSKVTISDNTPPVANAGPNQTMVNIGATVQLNGSLSTDVDGDPLTYQWSLIAPPPGSKAVLSKATLVNPTFVADLPGTYVAQLIVADNSVASPPATVQITTNQPLPPVANAGSNQTVALTLVSLNGSASTDPQGFQLTYSWSLTSKPTGSKATLTGATTATPTFLADLPGTYVAQLIVSDGYASSNPALPGSTVTISSSPLPPNANAGPAQSVNVGSTVTLNGSGSSDPNADPLTYSWTLTSALPGSKAALTNPNTVSPTFVPDVAGAYVAQLIVTDGFGLTSNPATVMITAAIVSTPTIIVQAGVQVNVGSQTPLSVNLSSPAPAGGVFVILASNSSNITLTPSSGIYFVSASSMFPTVTPKINGIGFGSATITATALGYQTATATVVSTDTVNFSPNTMTITGDAVQWGTVYLSSAAPASGVTLNLSSSNPAVATVPATVTIGSGSSSVSVPVKGVSGGTAVITAGNVGSNIAATTLNVTVNAVEITTTQLNNGLFDAPYSQQLTAINGTKPYTWSLASSSALPAGMTLSPGGVLGGTPTATTPVSGTPVTFKVTDSSVPAQTVTATLSLLIVVGVPASITATGGVNQQTADTTAFPTQLSATVKDVNGYLVPSVTVTFTVQSAASGASGTFTGNLTTVSAITNSSGVATAPVLTANGVLGSYTVSATVPQVTPAAAFNLTNIVGPAATITINSGSPQNTTEGTGFGTALSVTLKDAGGNLVPNAVVTFNVPPSGASASFTGGNTSTSNVSGIAVSNPVIAGGTAGSYIVTATSGTGSASFSLTNNVGSAASIAVTIAGTSIGINQAFPALVATVKDSGGNPVPNVLVTFAAVAGTNGQSATFNPATPVTTGSNGTAAVTATANNKVGQYSVMASAAGVATPFTLALTNIAGPAASIMPSSVSSQTVGDGAAFAPLVALVQDAGGNPENGVTVTFTITPAANGASATFSGAATAVTNASGLATSQGTLTANSIVGGPYNVTAAVNAQITTTFSLTNKVGSAAKIAVSGALPSPAGINTPFTALVAKVTDPGGNPVSGVSVTFQAPASAASGTFAGGLNSSTATTDMNGLATASTYTANGTTGADTVSAFVTAIPAISTTFALTNLVGSPATIAVNGSSTESAVNGVQFASGLSVVVKDSSGDLLSGVGVTFSSPASGASATFSGTTIATATTTANGIATSVAPIANSTPGSYPVTATVTGTSISTSFTLTNNPGTPASITPVTGTTPQTTIVNTAFPQALQVKVTDKSGNPEPGVTVTFTAVANNGASGTFGNSATTTAQTDSTGTASATLTANTKEGGFAVTASVTNPSLSATFTLTNNPGTPATVTATSGTLQSATIGTAFANPLVATVKDQYNNLVSGASVTFSAPSSGASAILSGSTTVTTGALGTATANATANLVAGAYSVTATTTGVSTPASFSLTNNPGLPATITIAGGNSQSAGVGTAYAPLSVTVTDSGNNPVPGATVTFTPTTGTSGASATFAGTNSATTNASGVATTQSALNANTTLGGFTVSARATTGSAYAVGFSLTNIPGPPKTITISGGTIPSVQVGQPFTVAMAVTVKDAHGNSVPDGTTVTFTATAVSGATGTFASGASTIVKTASGIAAAPAFTAGTVAGSYTVTVTSGSATLATPFSLSNLPAAAAAIAIKSGSPQSAAAGTKFATAMAVTVTDTYGNLVAATPVTFAPPAATGSNATGTFGTNTSISETTSAGIATVPASSLTAGTVAGNFSLTVTAGTATLQFPLTNTPGPAAKIAVSSGSPQSAQVGVPFTNPLVAVVTDSYSNLVSSATVTFTAPSSGPTGTFAPSGTSTTTATTDANGLATSTIYTPTTGAGTDSVTAKVGTFSTTFTLTNQSGPAAKITPVSSTNNQAVAVGQQFVPLAVTVTDIGGNLVSGATVTFTAPASGASGTFAPGGTATTTATTNASGVATSTVYTANTVAGADAVTVSVSPGTGSVTFSLTNKPGPAANVSATSGNLQQVRVGTNYAGLGVTVTDAFGNPVGAGVTVAFAVNNVVNGPGGAFTSGAAATTNASGVATSNALTANGKVGAFTVTASVVGGTTVATFSLTNIPGPPANVALTSGNNQSATVNTQFGTPLSVTATDSFGNPVAALTSVTFSAPTSSASGTFGSSGPTSTVTTNASGVATASPAFIANTTASASGVTYAVKATAGTATGSFALTNLPGPAATITATGGTVQTAYVGTPFASPLQALVRDAFNNPISGVTVVFTGPGLTAAQRPIFGDDPYGNTSTAVTGTSGIATSYSVSAGTGSGPAYTVTANVSPALAIPASYSLTNSATGGSTLGQITMTAAQGGNLTVGQNMMTEVQINLPAPAPSGGVTIKATTDGVNLMLGQNQGVQTEAIPFTAGQTSVNVWVQALSNVGGPFPITFEAQGYTTGEGNLAVTPSGFILAGPDGVVPPDTSTLSTFAGATSQLFVFAAQLDSNYTYVTLGQIRGGFTASVPIVVAGPAVGTITSPVTVAGGTFDSPVTFVATTTGAASINLGTASGFNQPNAYVTLPVTVGPASIVMRNATVGLNLETSVQFTLDGAAPACPGNSFGIQEYTVQSSSQNLLLSNSANTVGASSISVPVECGGSTSSTFYVQVVGGAVGSQLAYSASGPGFPTSPNGTITVGPAGFLVAANDNTPYSGQFFRSTVTGPGETILVYSYLLDGTAQENPVKPQSIAPSLGSVSVPINSDNPSVGTVFPTSVTISGGTDSASTMFTPVSGGPPSNPATANVKITTVPTGFTAANSAYSSIQAQVTNPSFSIRDGGTVGQFLQTSGTVGVGTAVSNSPMVIELQVISGDIALSTNGTDGGFQSIQVQIQPGSATSPTYFIYGLGSSSTGVYQVSYVSGGSGVNYTPNESTITLAPSGVALVGVNNTNQILTSAGSPTSFTVELGILNSSGGFVSELPAMGTGSVIANLSVSGSGTIGSPGAASLGVTFPAGTATVSVPFNPTSQGSATINLVSVTGATQVSTQNSIAVTIEP